MTANFNPIFSIAGNIGGIGQATITAAAADYTGANANNVSVFTAGTNGSYIERLRFKAAGTNGVAVARVYINNGSAHTSGANNTFYGEISLPSVTASTTAATFDIDYPMGMALPSNYQIFVGLGASVSSGWTVTVIGGNY